MGTVIAAHIPPFDTLNDSIAESITPNDIPPLTNDPEQIRKVKTIGDYVGHVEPHYENFPLPEEVKEMVEHPAHYNMGKYECIDVLEEVLKDLNGFEGFCIGNVIKYCWRLKYKDKPTEDAKKAAFYLNRCIDYLSKNER